MRKLFFLFVLFFCIFSGCTSDNTVSSENSHTLQGPSSQSKSESKMKQNKIEIEVNGTTYYANLYDNETAKAFVEMMPITLKMSELNSNEKYAYLDTDLPVNAQSTDSIETGDLMIYTSNCLVVFYEDFQTSYSYTPLGKIENPDNLKDVLGTGDIEITFKKE